MTRGFTSTVGDPFDVQWARGQGDWRHQVQFTLAYNILNTVRVSWYERFQSGLPYTPIIQGDVNGDGYANDRAFIYDPTDTADPCARERHAVIARQRITRRAQLSPGSVWAARGPE